MNRTFEMTLPESGYDKTVILIVGKYDNIAQKLKKIFKKFDNVALIDIKGLNCYKNNPCYLGLPTMLGKDGKVLDGICGHGTCVPPIWKIIWTLKVDRLLRMWKDKDWKEEYLKFPINHKEKIKEIILNTSKSLYHNKDVVVSFATNKTICMEGEKSLYKSSVDSQVNDILKNDIKVIYIMDGDVLEEHKKYEYLMDLKIDSKEFDDSDKVKNIIKERYNLKE